MAAGGARAAEPTLEPTARRLAEARRRGQIAFSGRLTAAAALAGAFAALALGGPALAVRLLGYLRAALAAALAGGTTGEAWAGTLGQALAGAAATAAGLLALPLGVAAAAALGVGLLQTRGLVTLAPLGVDLGRLSSRAGWGRAAGTGIAGAAGRGLLELAVLAAAAAVALRPALRALPALTGAPLSVALDALGALALRLGGALVVASLGLGVLDFALAFRRHRRALRMTREEARREARDTGGDPALRTERRRLHRALGRS